MKKSNIILLISLALILLYFTYPKAFGFVSVDRQGQPADPVSKFWLDLYPNKVSFDMGQTINHIKIIGNHEATVSLEVNKSLKNVLNTDDRQNFDYNLSNDTLEIQLKKGNTYLLLEQPTSVHAIYCTKQTDLQLIPTQPQDSTERLAITLKDHSMLKMGEYTKKYRFGSSSGTQSPVRIKNLEIDVSDQSRVYLGYVQSEKCVANLTDAYLNCERSSYIDSLKIHLNGKSSIKNTYSTTGRQRPYQEVNDTPLRSNIGYLIVSGNRSYFNTKFIRPNTQITIVE